MGNIDILIMLIFPIHERGVYFRLFVSSLISFFSVVQFSEYRSFTSLVRFTARYIIFLVAIWKGIFFWFVFLIFHYWCSKLPLISEYWLCISLVCQIYLLGQVVFSWNIYNFLCILSCHMQTMTVLLPPFQFGCPLFLFIFIF